MRRRLCQKNPNRFGYFLHDSRYYHIYLKFFENYTISKLDIKRVYRYLDKNVKKEVQLITDDDDDLDDYDDDGC